MMVQSRSDFFIPALFTRKDGPRLYTVVCKLQYKTDLLQVFPGIVRVEREGAVWDQTGEVKGCFYG